MKMLTTSVLAIASRFLGERDVPGAGDNATIVAMLRLDASWPSSDEVPWCSAFTNYVAWILRLPRSKSLAARSWLNVGVAKGSPDIGDIVILKRGTNHGPEVTDAPGHVGFFTGQVGGTVYVLGGNQSDQVSIVGFPEADVIGYRDITVGER